MQRAFSLVELSIVLVILGLLTGGILAGQSLIHAAELRSVTNDYQRYISATQTFRDKYFALPGDITNATKFWGQLGGNGANSTCQNAATNGIATCNGDGNGAVAFMNSNGVNESYRYWQHLANAGLIEGNYNGKIGVTRGLNLPSSKIGTATFTVLGGTGGYVTGDLYAYAGDWGTNIMNFANVVSGSPLIPEDAWNIDTKIDDGKPGGGALYAAKVDGTTYNCSTGDGQVPPADANATYVLTRKSFDCGLVFLRVF